LEKNRLEAKNWPKLGADILLLIGVVYCMSSLALCVSEQWADHAFPLLGNNIRMLPPFADLRAITAVAGCDVDINHIIEKTSAGCDPYGRSGGLGYPPFIYLIARGIGISGEWTTILSLTIGLAFIFAITSISAESILTKTTGGVLLLSLPSQLGLERMNIDILLFIGLLLVSLLREKDQAPKPGAIILASGLAFICTATKIYFVFGICSWLLAARLAGNHKPRFDLPVCLAAIAGLCTAIPWLASGDGFATPQLGLFSHGLMFKTSDGIAGGTTAVSAIFLFTGIYLASKNKRLGNFLKGYGRNIKTSRWGRTKTCMACSGLATWIGCFILTSNWDYRLVFTFPWILLLADMLRVEAHELPSGKTFWPLAAILGAALTQLLAPLAYILLSNVSGETMSLQDWISNPSGMVLRHVASLIINLSDIALLPYFAGSSLVVCWLLYANTSQEMKYRMKEQE